MNKATLCGTESFNLSADHTLPPHSWCHQRPQAPTFGPPKNNTGKIREYRKDLACMGCRDS